MGGAMLGVAGAAGTGKPAALLLPISFDFHSDAAKITQQPFSFRT
jgi:hypothetical protein